MAVDSMMGIGKDGTLPWPANKEDLKHFRDLTTGHIVVMGSKTWHDPCFPAPLKNRDNYVVTSSLGGREFTGVHGLIGAIGDLKEQIIALDNTDKDVWIIGGASIIEQCWDIIEIFHLTIIKGDFECDTRLNINLQDFDIVSKEERDNTYLVLKGRTQ